MLKGPGRARISRKARKISQKRVFAGSEYHTRLVKKTLIAFGCAFILATGVFVWRVLVAPRDGGGSWEVHTSSGGSGIDALFVHQAIPGNLAEAWRMFSGGIVVERYDSKWGQGEGSADFKRSAQIAKTAAESAMRAYQIRGESTLEVVGVTGRVPITKGEHIVGINGGPASMFLWREAINSAVPESRSGKPSFTYPVYLLLENAQGERRSELLEVGFKKVRGVWVVDPGVDVREHNGVGERVMLPESNMHGTSAGLSMALGFFNQGTGMCLELGGEIAATGTVTEYGAVLGIGGVREKTEAAIASGNALMLVPETNYREALAQSRGRIRIVSVSSVNEAVEKLLRDYRVRACISLTQARERIAESKL